MVIFNKMFQMKCVFLIVTCLLGDAQFHYINDTELVSISKSSVGEPIFENATDVNQSPQPQDLVTTTESKMSPINTSINETTASSISTRSPNIDDTTSIPQGTSSPKPDYGVSGTRVNFDSANETTVLSDSTPNSNPDKSDEMLKTNNPKDSSTDAPSVPSVSTPTPNTDDTSSLSPDVIDESISIFEDVPFVSGEIDPMIEDDFSEEKTDSSVPEETQFESTVPSVFETTTPAVISVTSSKPSHISKISKKNNSSILDTSAVSFEDEIVWLSNTGLNTEKPANSKDEEIEDKETSCSSVRTSLIDSVSNTFIDFLKQLVGMSVNALDKSFNEVFKSIMPSLLKNIASFLEHIRVNMDENFYIVMNSTLGTVLEKKISVHDKFNIMEKLLNGTQRTAIIKANHTISAVFEKIESWLDGFYQPESFSSTVLDDALHFISAKLNRTINDFLRSVGKVAEDKAIESRIVKNSSSGMIKLVGDFLNSQSVKFGQLSNTRESVTELVNYLTEITTQYRNSFVKDVVSLVIDSLIEVDDKERLLDELWKRISLVLRDLRESLFRVKMNQTKYFFSFTDLDEFENSSMLAIENTLNSIQSTYSSSEFTNPIRDVFAVSKQLYDSLQNITYMAENGSVNMVLNLIQNSFYETILCLQKEVPGLLEANFFNSSSSLNTDVLNSTYNSILRNYSGKLDTCGKNSTGETNFFNSSSSLNMDVLNSTYDSILRNYSEKMDTYGKNDTDESIENNVTEDPNFKINVSTSMGVFTHPFEYLLVFTVINYFVMW